mmetsp:Transcript_19892/g.44161  ORF Transcript_19892/g.44161 Transcript_19892/m.44161 type:complete len:389 (-) Transcript_19892:2127-3293(-)
MMPSTVRRAGPVVLRDLFKIAQARGARRFEAANFVHEELIARLNERVGHLSSLPHGLSDTGSINSLRTRYADWAQSLRSQRPVGSESDDRHFSSALRSMLGDNPVGRSRGEATASNSFMLAAVQQRALEKDGCPLFTLQANELLDEFFTSRLGMRLLMTQYLEGEKGARKSSSSIRSNFDGVKVARQSADTVRSICSRLHGAAPRIEVSGSVRDFAYVPAHVDYVLTEVLKNSARATVENAPKNCRLPEIKINVVQSGSECRIIITDSAGGIPAEDMGRIFSYFTSTATTRARFGENGQAQMHEQSLALAGFGIGLPLSRLYCRYFGGDLTVETTAGQGSVTTMRLQNLTPSDVPLPVASLLPRDASGVASSSNFFSPAPQVQFQRHG